MMFRIALWPKARENDPSARYTDDPALLNGKGRALIFNISLLFYTKSHAIVDLKIMAFIMSG